MSRVGAGASSAEGTRYALQSMSLPPALAAARSDDVLTAAVIQLVRERVGVDFSQYRPATIERRIRNRMLAVGAACLSEYLQRLTAAPDEAEALVERLVIKVSRFYRNAATFDLLRSTVVPALVAETHRAPLHVWCAGCSGGEEAYTYAMLLDEAGVAGTIHATDIARDALAAAAAGTYRPDALDELPEDLAHRYLEPVSVRGDERYRVVDALRARVRFSRHDVTVGPLEGAFSIVSCRNVLIYLQRPAQVRAMHHLSAGLTAGSVLVLGEAEWPSPALEPTLDVLGHKARVFRRAADGRGMVA